MFNRFGWISTLLENYLSSMTIMFLWKDFKQMRCFAHNVFMRLMECNVNLFCVQVFNRLPCDYLYYLHLFQTLVSFTFPLLSSQPLFCLLQSNSHLSRSSALFKLLLQCSARCHSITTLISVPKRFQHSAFSTSSNFCCYFGLALMSLSPDPTVEIVCTVYTH
jgi:hypothetical protein